MVRKQEHQQQQQQRDNQPRRTNNNQGGSFNQGQRNFQDQGNRKESHAPRSNYRDRDNSFKPNYGGQNQTSNNTGTNSNSSYSSRYSNRVKAVETIDDIKTDITRLEKEIELELKEIRSLRLGL
ncbi:MAG: hypothetical protein K0R31_2028 [Clostridiales bacterium]|jgi:hypothetical protein|nr:hypothetical protein [Clostridiales bacterium]